MLSAVYNMKYSSLSVCGCLGLIKLAGTLYERLLDARNLLEEYLNGLMGKDFECISRTGCS